MSKKECSKPLQVATTRYYYKPMAAFFNAFHLRAFWAADVELRSPVLDVGCSDGEYGLLLAEILGPPDQITGVDISAEAIASAGSQAKELYDKMVVASATTLPFKDKSFNSVVVNASLTSIDPDLDKALHEAGRILKTGGVFYATVCTDQYEHKLWINRLLSRVGLHRMAARYRKSMNRRMQQAHLLPHQEWIERIERGGFTVIDHFGFMPLSLVPFWSFLAWTPLRAHSVFRFMRSPRLHRAVARLYQRLFAGVYNKTPSRLDSSRSGYVFIAARRNARKLSDA